MVDDDPDTVRIVTAYLSEEGISTSTAANGREALEMLHRSQPDLVFLDLVMPEMDGLAFLHRLRADSRYRDLPVVVITARDLSTHELSCLASGTLAMIDKASNLKENLGETLCRSFQHTGLDVARSESAE